MSKTSITTLIWTTIKQRNASALIHLCYIISSFIFKQTLFFHLKCCKYSAALESCYSNRFQPNLGWGMKSRTKERTATWPHHSRKVKKNETYIFDFSRFVSNWRQCPHGKNLLNVTFLDLPKLNPKAIKRWNW